MSNFEPKSIKMASYYLQDRLDIFKKGKGIKEDTGSIYVVDNTKKDSMLKRLVGSIFHS